MSSVSMDSILGSKGASSSTGTSTNKANNLGMEDFLALLIKQLQFQDPTNPVENTEFTAQLAQFSSLQALTNMKTSMDNINTLVASSNNLTAMSLIGKNVVAEGNIVNFSGTSENLSFTLDDLAQTVTVKIYDSDGSLVRTAEMKSVAKGDSQYAWDGKDDDGNTVSQGKYYFTVSGTDYKGKTVGTTTYAKGQVTGVTFEDGATYLTVGNKQVSLSDVQQISN